MAAVSLGWRPTGFSQAMCLPAAAAASASSRCRALGAVISMTSMSSRSMTSRQSSVPLAKPKFSTASCDPLRDRVGDRDQPRPQAALGEVDRDVPIGARVSLPHPAEAEHPDPDRRRRRHARYLPAEVAVVQTSGLTEMPRAAARQPVDDLLEGGAEDPHLAIGRRRGDMRRDDDVVTPEERMVDRQRLGLRDVQPGPEQVSGRERGEQCVAVDQPAARRVDEDGARLHPPELLGPEQVARRVAQRHVDRDDIRGPEQRLQRGDRVHAGREVGLGEEWVVGRDRHPHRAADGRHMPRDASATDQPEDLALELDRLLVGVVVAAALAEPGFRPLDALGDHEHQRHGVLRGRDRRRIGRVADRDATPRRLGDVDEVVADAGPGDEAQARGTVHQLGVVAHGRSDRRLGPGEAGVWIAWRRGAKDGHRSADLVGELRHDGSLEPDRRPLGGRDHAIAPGPVAPNDGSARPRVPVSMANNPPASRWPGALGRDPPPPIDGHEHRRQSLAAEGGHGRLLDRQADALVDGAGWGDADHGPAADAGDPVAAVLVDAGAIGSTGQVAEVEEHALVGRLARCRVVVVGPDGLPMRVGEVHRRAIRGEGEAVGDPDPRAHGRHLAARIHAVEEAGEPAGGRRVVHAAHPEAAGRVAATVVQPIVPSPLARGAATGDMIPTPSRRRRATTPSPPADGRPARSTRSSLAVRARVAAHRCSWPGRSDG